jgi:hypothetical protein
MAGYRAPWIGAVAAILSVVLASCASTGTPASESVTTASRNVTPLSADDAMVIEVSAGGGLAPAVVRVSDTLPRIWISGDGRYLRQTSDGSGSPALAAMEERRLSDAAVTGLLEDARAAGLFEDDPGYGRPLIADAMVTRIVTVSGGTRHEVLVSALGYPNPGLTDIQMAARAQLSKFLDALKHPEGIAGAGPPAPFVPAAIAVFVLGTASPSTPSPPATWPLGDLGTAGHPTDWPTPAARCLVVAGGDTASVVSATAGRDRSTPWRSGDGLWNIALRPLLPDERSCADVPGG